MSQSVKSGEMKEYLSSPRTFLNNLVIYAPQKQIMNTYPQQNVRTVTLTQGFFY